MAMVKLGAEGWGDPTVRRSKKKKNFVENFLVVQWLEPHTFTAEGPGVSPSQELRSHVHCSVAEKLKLIN